MRGGGAPLAFSDWRTCSCAPRRSCTGGARFHITVFGLSYQERDGWNGAEHGWLWAGGTSASKSSRNFTMNASIDQAAISLAMATLLGACIGFERQWRQRMAGLRTNTLGAIGAARFLIFVG